MIKGCRRSEAVQDSQHLPCSDVLEVNLPVCVLQIQQPARGTSQQGGHRRRGEDRIHRFVVGHFLDGLRAGHPHARPRGPLDRCGGLRLLSRCLLRRRSLHGSGGGGGLRPHLLSRGRSCGGGGPRPCTGQLQRRPWLPGRPCWRPCSGLGISGTITNPSSCFLPISHHEGCKRRGTRGVAASALPVAELPSPAVLHCSPRMSRDTSTHCLLPELSACIRPIGVRRHPAKHGLVLLRGEAHAACRPPSPAVPAATSPSVIGTPSVVGARSGDGVVLALQGLRLPPLRLHRPRPRRLEAGR
mmetsp:Transcript_55658/g.162745  ORF Transcript_55658/g.162745 Transcript_55658/m.162745 type:complete len:300 (+) Transcript_55658:38-937(+)